MIKRRQSIKMRIQLHVFEVAIGGVSGDLRSKSDVLIAVGSYSQSLSRTTAKPDDQPMARVTPTRYLSSLLGKQELRIS